MAVCPADAAAAASNKTKKEAGQRPLACDPALSRGAFAVDPSSRHPRITTRRASRSPPCVRKALPRAGDGNRPCRQMRAPRQSRYRARTRSEEHTSELQSLMRISYAVFCLKKKQKINKTK